MSTFLDVQKWWDLEPVRVIPEEHGQDFQTQLDSGVRIFQSLAASGRPFSLIRLGDSELAILSGGLVPLMAERDIDGLLGLGGMDRSTLSFRPRLLDAVQRTDVLGLHQNWKPVSQGTFTTLSMMHLPTPPPNAIEVHVVYSLLVSGVLFDFLQDKRVLLVGSRAEELATFLRNAEVSPSYPFVRPLKHVSAIQTPGYGERSYLVFDQVAEAASKASFDVALIGWGTCAKILAVAVRDQGRVGLDVGFCFDALLGHTERSLRPVLRDYPW